MPLVTNESDIKQESAFNKLRDGSVITLLSNAYEIKSHFLKDKNKSALCQGEACILCKKGLKSNREFYYLASVQNEGQPISVAVTKIPSTIVISMNENEKKLKSDKRNYSWIAGKTGEGLQTRWSVVRGDNAPKMDAKTLEQNNKKLVETMDQREAEMDTTYNELIFTDGETPGDVDISQK